MLLLYKTIENNHLILCLSFYYSCWPSFENTLNLKFERSSVSARYHICHNYLSIEQEKNLKINFLKKHVGL